MKLLVIGNPEAVLGFSLVGVSGIKATNETEVNSALDEALKIPETGIILVTEDVGALIEARMNDLKMRSTVPLVVEIPAPEGVRPERPSLREVVMRAIGIKIS
jgi:V/A-type H+-transporting ATPase subunit F